MSPAPNGVLLASLGAPSPGSGLSLWSEDSFLSIGSKGSVLSIGSVGSFASIGSIGSAASAFSVGSAASAGSVLSWASAGSVMSAAARDSILGEPEQSSAGLLSGGILLACGAAIAGWAIYRSQRFGGAARRTGGHGER